MNFITDDVRQELAEKLDRELDAHIANLPKREPGPPRPIEEVEAELMKHPAFMKQSPGPDDQLDPLYEGLQNLKYDPDVNDPCELAKSCKEDGNYYFKVKNYKRAIFGYNEGIKIKCGDPEIEAPLYNNRAAAHYLLQNYRSSLEDCKSAIKFKPDYNKAIERAANCCFNLKRYDEAIKYCDMILEKQKDNKPMTELRNKCVLANKVKQRDERKLQKEQKRKQMEDRVLLNEIKKRQINLEGDQISLEQLEPHFPQLVHHRVFLDESGCLIWPAVFLYPEYKIMDYIEGFSENHTFDEQINHVYQTIPEWDDEKKYIPDKISVYYENKKKGQLVEVKKKQTLGEVLSSVDYVIQGGTPSFMIIVKDSNAGKSFINSYN